MSQFEPKPFGKYFLTDRIAVGGMAEIYKAKTFGVDGFEKTLAIKKILSNYSQDKDFVTMLTDEAKLVVHLSHPNIIQVYDLGRVGNDYFISMEYINGVNARELINRAQELNQEIPLEVCLFIALETCKGLDYAHTKLGPDGQPLNIVHRDVSPHNILVSFDGEVKLTDFGIAKAAQNVSQTQLGTLKGKVTYMSPEQALGKPTDHRTDIFSTGIILYEMVTRDRLYDGDTQMEVLEKIRQTKITKKFLKEKVSHEIYPMLLKALSYLPRDRYRSASDMQVALTKLLYARHQDFTPRRLSELLKDWFVVGGGQENTVSGWNEKKAKELASSEATSHQQVTLVQRESETDLEGDTLKAGDWHSSALEHKDRKPLLFQKPFSFLKTFMAIGVVAIVILGIFRYQGLKETVLQPPQSVVEITSDPPDARIFLNGESTPLRTPAKLEKLEIGQEMTLELKKDGYEDFKEILLIDKEELSFSYPLKALPPPPEDSKIVSPPEKIEEKPPVVEVKPDVLENIDLTLPEKTYAFSLTADVSGASVKINGKDYGKAPINTTLPSGKYTVIVSKNGYQEMIKTFEIGEAAQDLRVSLKKNPVVSPKTTPPPQRVKEEIKTSPQNVSQFAKLRIDSSPRGAAVQINGQKHGVTPIVVSDLPKNVSLTVVVSKSGYQAWNQTLNLKRDYTEVRANLNTR